MWVLYMNKITAPAGTVDLVCTAKSEVELVDFIAREKVAPYDSNQYRKCFREGGPLEWFNDEGQIRDFGTEEQWIAETIEKRNDALAKITAAAPDVSKFTN